MPGPSSRLPSAGNFGLRHQLRSGFGGAILLFAAACSPNISSPSQSPPAVPSAPTPTPAPTPVPTPDFSAVIAAINRSPVRDIHVEVGTRDGTVFTFQKGSFAPSAITPIGSAAKFYSGVTIMRLVEAGVLNLDDHPQRYLDYWTRDPSDPRSRVTLQQLLSFTSGFNAGELEDGCITEPATTIADCAREYYERGLGSLPGSAFAYGPAHLQIAAAMAEAATGKSFATLFAEQVAAPAGMSTATDYVAPSRSNPRVAAGVHSTAADGARFLQALLDGRLIRDLDGYLADRTGGLLVLNQPSATLRFGQWRYALSAWRECDETPFSDACASQRTISSPGAFGWTPWVDFDRGYWGLIAMREGFSGSLESVRLEQELQPLIARALGAPDPSKRYRHDPAQSDDARPRLGAWRTRLAPDREACPLSDPQGRSSGSGGGGLRGRDRSATS